MTIPAGALGNIARMTTTLAQEPVATAPEPERHEPPPLELASYGDLVFRWLLTLAAAAIPVLLGFLVYELWSGSRLAIDRFGFDFVTTSRLGSGRRGISAPFR